MKGKFIVILTVFIGLLSACNTGGSAEEDMPFADIYSLALDALMEEDKGLNNDMAFIAIDLSNFEDLNETGKQSVLDHFSNNYDVEVKDATFEELRESGYYNEETMVLDGVLLRMEKVDVTSNKVIFTGSKYRSGLGAIGMEVTLQLKGGEWQVSESKMIWIA